MKWFIIKIHQTPKLIKLSKNNFSFAFGLQDQEYTNYMDESIYNVSAVYTRVISHNNGTTFFFFRTNKYYKM